MKTAPGGAIFIPVCALALAVIVAIAVATPGAPGNPGRARAAPAVVVEVSSNWFCSAAFENGVCETAIQAGDSVEWNFLAGVHNATECGDNWSKGSSCAGAAWASDLAMIPPASFSHVFDSAGTFYYRCTLHPDAMKGTVVVTVANPPTPTPSPPPTPIATTLPTLTPSITPRPSPTPTATPVITYDPTATSNPTATAAPTVAPPPTATSTPSPPATATPVPPADTPGPTPPATSGPSASPATTPAPTAAPTSAASATPQQDPVSQPPSSGGGAKSPVLGAGELPNGGGWPSISDRFDVVGLLFAVNLPLAALAFSAFRWYLQRRSAA